MQISTEHFRNVLDKVVQKKANNCNTRKTEPTEVKPGEQIRSLEIKEFQALRHILKDLERSLIIEHVLDQKELQPYHSVASALRDCIPHQGSEDASNPPDWETLIRLGYLHLQQHQKTYDNPSTLEALNSRFYALAESALRLRNLGYPCVIDDGLPIFAEATRLQIVENIEKLIGKLGGLTLLNHLFKTLEPQFNEQLQRFLFPRHFGIGKKNPSLPFNFLIQLSLKQPTDTKISVDRAQEIWDEICELATCFTAIYNIEPHSQWGLIFQDTNTIIEYVVDLTLYDQFFRFRQMRDSDVPTFLTGIFKWVTPEQEAKIGFSIANAIKACKRILEDTESKTLNIFKKEDLIKQLISEGIPNNEADNIITCLTHQQAPNQNYKLPEAPKTLDAFLHPIVTLSNDSLAVIDKAICAPAFYESIATAVRPTDTQTQDKIGLAAEDTIIDHFRKHGITMHSGKYKFPGRGQGECDAIIETDDTVIFIELKAKALTSAAQSGQDLDIFIDLFKSLFKATSQAIGHELVLHKQGKIDLEDGNVISLNGREVEKIAVTLLDFGSLQDRTVIENLLLTLLNTELAPKDDTRQKDYDKFNALLATLREQIVELQSHSPKGQATKPFFTCWFLSVPQLLVLCDGCKSNQDFKDALWKTRHFSTQSLDWYTDHHFATNHLGK